MKENRPRIGWYKGEIRTKERERERESRRMRPLGPSPSKLAPIELQLFVALRQCVQEKKRCIRKIDSN